MSKEKDILMDLRSKYRDKYREAYSKTKSYTENKAVGIDQRITREFIEWRVRTECYSEILDDVLSALLKL